MFHKKKGELAISGRGNLSMIRVLRAIRAKALTAQVGVESSADAGLTRESRGMRAHVAVWKSHLTWAVEEN